MTLDQIKMLIRGTDAWTGKMSLPVKALKTDGPSSIPGTHRDNHSYQLCYRILDVIFSSN